jgi:hypothetical protein
MTSELMENGLGKETGDVLVPGGVPVTVDAVIQFGSFRPGGGEDHRDAVLSGKRLEGRPAGALRADGKQYRRQSLPPAFPEDRVEYRPGEAVSRRIRRKIGG